MNECRFDADFMCRTHDDGMDGALCATAAQALQRRLDEGKDLLHDSEGLLQRQQELNEALQRRVEEAAAKAFDWEEHWKNEHAKLIQLEVRLASLEAQLAESEQRYATMFDAVTRAGKELNALEARNAVLREAAKRCLERLKGEVYPREHFLDPKRHGYDVLISLLDAALAPRAGEEEQS